MIPSLIFRVPLTDFRICSPSFSFIIYLVKIIIVSISKIVIRVELDQANSLEKEKTKNKKCPAWESDPAPHQKSAAQLEHHVSSSSNVLSIPLTSNEHSGQVHLAIKTHMASSPARRGTRQESSVGEEKEIMRWNVDSGKKKKFF